jgi:hypothetical protein
MNRLSPLEDVILKFNNASGGKQPPGLTTFKKLQNADSRRTILLSVPHGWHARLLLRTNYLDHLTEDNDNRIVVLSPSADEKEFTSEFTDRCEFFPLEPQGGKLFNYLYPLRRLTLFSDEMSDSFKIKLENFRAEGRKIYLAAKFLNWAIKKIPGFKHSLIWLDHVFFKDRKYKNIFQKTNPDLIVLCSTFTPQNFFLLRRARQEGIKTLHIVLSWDNPTCKVYFYDMPDHHLVWNEINRQELVHYHGIPADTIEVTGSAYHDIYAHPERFASREEVADRYGLDPSRKWIFMGSAMESYFPRLEVLIGKLAEAINQDSLAFPCQLFIRPHPQVITGYSRGEGGREMERYKAMSPHIFVDHPHVVSQKLPVDLDTEDVKNLAEIMYHSDVHLNFVSTLSIDACAAGTPVIIIGFDSSTNVPFFQSIARYQAYNHLRNLISTGGVKVAHSFEMLTNQINDYLLDPSQDREGRATIVREQCYFLDGKSAERMARATLKFLQSI